MRTIEEALEYTVVIGAAGNMGAGITLLLAQAIAQMELEKWGEIGTGRCRLLAIDAREKGLYSLRHTIKTQLQKWGERHINFLRRCFARCPTLVSNEEIVRSFVEGAADNVRYATTIYEARGARLIFEAITEDIAAKIELFQMLNAVASSDAFYCSNTSSIPIASMAKPSGLGKRLIGFHFYNPAAHQRLVEVVIPEKNKATSSFTRELAARLGKQLIPSKDVAGFIGNGYLIRELAFACQKVQELCTFLPASAAIYLVNRVTEEMLVRPMGIFQLADYVGLNICHRIATIMSEQLADASLLLPLLSELASEGIIGGHDELEGYRKGFFFYKQGRASAVIDPASQQYQLIEGADWLELCQSYLGVIPGDVSWKTLQKQTTSALDRLMSHFAALLSQKCQETFPGAALAQAFLQNLRHIADLLVGQGIAKDRADFDAVLKIGFGHLYSPYELWLSAPIGIRSK